MSDVIPSKLSGAERSEKDAWRRYAEAKGDDWRQAYTQWVEARDAALVAWTDEFNIRHE
jgi:hypothetical protein